MWKIFTTLSVLIGLLLISLSLYYLTAYFTEVENAYRNEYMAGMIISIVMSSPFWFLASFLVFKNRATVPNVIYTFTLAVTMGILLLFIAGVVITLFLIMQDYVR